MHRLPSISDVERDGHSAFLPSSAPSVKAADLAAPFQPANVATATLVATLSSRSRTTRPLRKAQQAIRKVPKVLKVVFIGFSAHVRATQNLVELNVSQYRNPRRTTWSRTCAT